jgi:hypothetical protein
MGQMMRISAIGAAVLVAWAAIVHCASAQTAKDRKSHDPETSLAAALINVWLGADQNSAHDRDETVAKEARSALEKMGTAAAPALADELGTRWKKAQDAIARGNEEDAARQLKDIKLIAQLLGSMGNAILRLRNLDPRTPTADDPNPKKYFEISIRIALMEILKADMPPKNGSAHPCLLEARQAAIEALGRIYAQKGIYMRLSSPEFKELQGHHGDFEELAKMLQNRAQSLKAKFLPLKEKNELAIPEPQEVLHLLLDARNLQRKYSIRSKLFALLSELEPPSGKEKNLSHRIESMFADIESNLQIVVAVDKNGKLEDKKDRMVAWLKANQKAHELCEEWEILTGIRIPIWKSEMAAVAEVLRAFGDTLQPERRPHFTISMSIAEALRRIYGTAE